MLTLIAVRKFSDKKTSASHERQTISSVSDDALPYCRGSAQRAPTRLSLPKNSDGEAHDDAQVLL